MNTPRLAQALGEEYHPGTPAVPKGPIETFTMRHGPSATHPLAHEVAGFGVGAFGEPSAGCSELYNLVARVSGSFLHGVLWRQDTQGRL